MKKYNYTVIKEDSKLDPILLLHGWGGSLKSLTALQEKLSKELKNPIYNLELPGFGETILEDRVYGTHDYAKFVAEFVKTKKLKDTILIGHSFGGKTSVDLIVSKLLRPQKLILINSSGIQPRNATKKTVNKLLLKLVPKKIKESEKLKNMYYKFVLRERDYLDAGQLKNSLAKIVNEHYQDKLGKIHIPTLVIWAELDGYVPLWMGREFAKRIRLSKLVVVPNTTHGLPLREPELVAEIVGGWVD